MPTQKESSERMALFACLFLLCRGRRSALPRMPFATLTIKARARKTARLEEIASLLHPPGRKHSLLPALAVNVPPARLRRVAPRRRKAAISRRPVKNGRPQGSPLRENGGRLIAAPTAVFRREFFCSCTGAGYFKRGAKAPLLSFHGWGFGEGKKRNPLPERAFSFCPLSPGVADTRRHRL